MTSSPYFCKIADLSNKSTLAQKFLYYIVEYELLNIARSLHHYTGYFMDFMEGGSNGPPAKLFNVKKAQTV